MLQCGNERDVGDRPDGETSGAAGALSAPLQDIGPAGPPTLLVIGEARRADMLGEKAERAGLRYLGCIAPDSLPDRLMQQAELDNILIDLRGIDVAHRLDRRLAAVVTGRYGPHARLSVITGMDDLDHAMALLGFPGVEFLCEPSEADIVTLLVMAGLRSGSSTQTNLYDATRETETQRLEQLSEEVRRLAVTIERMTQASGTGLSGPGMAMDRRGAYRADGAQQEADPARLFEPGTRHRGADSGGSALPSHAEIRAIIRARRMRDQFLPADLFADPAWDMILDLMAARLAGQRVSVSSLCIAAAVPPTTALRHIRQLTDRAVFARIDDPVDGRRVFIELTDAAAQAVIGWAQAVRRNGGMLAGATR